MKLDEAVRLYVETRDARDALRKRHEEELKPYGEALETLEGIMQRQLDETGQESARTEAGTCYKAGWSSARVQDWAQVLDFAVEHGRLDLFERRVNKKVVEELGEVPGIVIDRGVRINVRRA